MSGQRPGPRLAPTLAAAALLAVGIASAEGVRPPPTGWQSAPAPTIAPLVPSAPPACCATDATCCDRQALIDHGLVGTPDAVLTVFASDLPEAVVRRAPAPAPAIEGAPALRFIDGHGQPPPWGAGAYYEIRLMPPGPLGDVARGGFYEPYFEPEALRGQGYGMTHYVDEHGVTPFLAGPVRFHSLSAGPSGTLAYDVVEGALDTSLHTTVRSWVHADARPILRGVVFAFRRTDEDGEKVHLVLPEVILGTTSRGVDFIGGFDSSSRFSRAWSFTEYTIDAAPGAAELVTFTVAETEVRSLRATGVVPSQSGAFTVTVDLTRAASDASARIRLHVFEPTAR